MTETFPTTAEPAAEPALAKAYDPAQVETGVYDRWDAAGYFQPRDRRDREAVRGHHAAAERDRRTAHRPRPLRRPSKTS